MRGNRSTEQGQLATASPSSGGQGAGEREQRAKSKEQGARNAAGFGYRLSVLGYPGGQRRAEIPDQWSQDAASGGYRLSDYKQEQELEMIGG
jgi:hypothetical protein